MTVLLFGRSFLIISMNAVIENLEKRCPLPLEREDGDNIESHIGSGEPKM